MNELMELAKRVKNGSLNAKTEFRQESKQKFEKKNKLVKLDRENGDGTHVVVFNELAIPFNPATGFEDDEYNMRSKWRPGFSATKSALIIKALANQDEQLKANLCSALGVEDWDTSKLDEITEQDFEIFLPYSEPYVTTSFGIKTKVGFGQFPQYGTLFHVDADMIDGRVVPTQKEIVDGVETPVHHPLLKYSNFEYALAEAKLAYRKEKENLNESSVKEARTSLMTNRRISGYSPQNNVLCMQIFTAQNNKAAMPFSKFKSVSDISENLISLGYTKSLRDALAQSKNGILLEHRESLDVTVFQITFVVGNLGNKQISFSSPGKSFTSKAERLDYYKLAKDFMDSSDSKNLETVLLASSYKTNFSVSEHLGTIIEDLAGYYDIAGLAISEDIFKTYDPLFQEVYPSDKYEELFEKYASEELRKDKFDERQSIAENEKITLEQARLEQEASIDDIVNQIDQM